VRSGKSLACPWRRRIWAPRGQPPTLAYPFNWKKASMAAAICYGCALVVAATLAAMNLAGMTAVAQPDEVSENWNAYNQSTRVPPAELKAQRALSDRQAYYNQATRLSPAELEAWTQANDRAGTPATPPAEVPAPAEPSGEPGWLVVSLGILAAAMAVAGLAVLTARRAVRTARLGQAT
jgi:hypothetical protein